MKGRVALIGGGVRSGKSRFALEWALARAEPRSFIATAARGDAEMRRRIEAHRKERGTDFETIEEPLALPARLRELSGSAGVVVVDCLTLWLSNLLLAGEAHGESVAECDLRVQAACPELVASLDAPACDIALVTNEVGMGIVPPSELGRRFRDHAGRLHQQLATLADEVYLAAMGLVLRLHPAPVEVVSR